MKKHEIAEAITQKLYREELLNELDFENDIDALLRVVTEIIYKELQDLVLIRGEVVE